MFSRVEEIQFPEPTGITVNMMPIIAGDPESIPEHLRGYLRTIDRCRFPKGATVYLTVMESPVGPGDTQRRPGLHTDGTASFSWGGGGWGGGVPEPLVPVPMPPTPSTPIRPTPRPQRPVHTPVPEKGIFMASSDGRCRVFDCITYDVDNHGSLQKEPDAPFLLMEPSVLYWMTDRTPHESLPSLRHHTRQFFRLVGDEVGIWLAQHSTANPLGVKPNCPVEHGSKFS